jgi:uracil-DNA glycosylase
MMNEVPPMDPEDDFYSGADDPEYMKTTRELFRNAGISVADICDILDLGIYITAAVKRPKQQYEVYKDFIMESIPLLEKEMNLFPNLKVIMLMGDVAT